MDRFENFNKFEEENKIQKFLSSWFGLQAQIENPAKEGMISALKKAKEVAGKEITKVEIDQGDVFPTPWFDIPHNELYRKLFQYQQALYNYGVKKFGEEAFNKMINNNPV